MNAVKGSCVHKTSKRKWLRQTLRVALSLLTLLIAGIGILYILARPSLGTTPRGARLERIKQSVNWNGDSFSSGRLSWIAASDTAEPASTSAPPPPVAVVQTDPRALRTTPRTGLRLTWFGHSSTLVQLDGINVLTDPFWSDRATPIAGIGPKRWYPPPIAVTDLPRIDAVVISHDHYDHLDTATILALKQGSTRFIVPLGVGAHLETWGVPVDRIVELDWGEIATIRGVEIHATPARHYSGRLVPQGDTSLWAGYALIGPRNRVYYTGDTSYMPEIVDGVRRLGPFDLVLTDSGQYNPDWPDRHLGPEQAVKLAAMVGAKTMVPIHWGLIRLSNHSWSEPAERTLAAALCHGVRVLVPPPGLPVEPSVDRKLKRWWPSVALQAAVSSPIRSSQNGNGRHRFELAPCKRS